MEQRNTRLRNAGFVTFFFSGICTISSGVVVSLLQEEYGFAYGMTGTLLSLLSIGNLLAGLLAGALVGKMGMKPSVLLLTIGYAVGYGLMGLTGLPILLALAFFIVGIAKGSVLNTCTILVSGNSADRTRGMNTMHACYACGALLCPFLISAAARVSTTLAVLALAALGLVLWLVYLFTPMAGRAKTKEAVTDWSFLRSSRFWLLTGLLFCQNAAEQSVVGWMVTYFKDSGIIAGTLAAYTVTVMWGATLIGRLLIAFVFPLRQPRKTMVFMAVFCTAFYFAMMQTHSQLPAILLLFAFAFSMAGMNPTAVASAGKMTTVTSMGIMLPVASSGAILMPWVIGKVAESAGLAVGMATNIVPCGRQLAVGLQWSCRRRRLSGSPPRLCAELTPTVILTVKPVLLRKLERAQVAVLLFEIRGQVPDAEFGFKLLPDLIDAGRILVGADGERGGEPIKAVRLCVQLSEEYGLYRQD